MRSDCRNLRSRFLSFPYRKSVEVIAPAAESWHSYSSVLPQPPKQTHLLTACLQGQSLLWALFSLLEAPGGGGVPRMHLGEGGGAHRWEGGEDKERG